MLFIIAWRNIWRNKGRSLVVMGSIVVGIWALIFATGAMNAFMVGYMADIINHDVSNLQVHHPDFKTDRDVQFTIPNGEQKADELRHWEGVKATTTRTLVNGMIASPRKASGVQIRGVDVANETRVTAVDSLITEGSFFQNVRRNPIVLGNQLAEELRVSERSKVVLTFNDANGNITSAAFRVDGIVKSSSVNISKQYAFVKQEDLTRLLGLGGLVHELAILTEPHFDEKIVVDEYQSKYPDDLIETWREISPEMDMMQEMYGSMLYVLMVIIMLALVFGIINTMLMAVLERTRELGMLMAVGMSKVRVYSLVLLETIFLGILGAPIGLGLGYLTIRYFSETGVDLSQYSEGLESFGYSSILYPYIESGTYFQIVIAVLITAFVGAVYPAWKAVRLKPVEALHMI
ncbi:ABC transporter permease [Marinoscillum sp. MHG1-6]|uniref:ABC transporter permease n=1 Tax=Marinoscillum sp. MHG1-6 TaxID=2959627 RepID=UPI0021581072|nr:FtsX-like permease family protein [Marinoscillum sp. MHG1-6]